MRARGTDKQRYARTHTESRRCTDAEVPSAERALASVGWPVPLRGGCEEMDHMHERCAAFGGAGVALNV
jgi:hypothetical protein